MHMDGNSAATSYPPVMAISAREEQEMTRVAVIGNAGGGKSTMCRSLRHVQQLPYYAIDKIQWKPNWGPSLFNK